MKKRKVIAIFSSFMYIFGVSGGINDRVVIAHSTVFHPNNVTLSLVNNGEASIKNLMIRLINSVDRVSYIWGGGRNKVNGKRVIDTVGIPDVWLEFRRKQDHTYNWTNYCKYENSSNNGEVLTPDATWIPVGTDCSGFMALLLRNTLPECKINSFVAQAKSMARFLGTQDLGTFVDFSAIKSVSPGDIVSMNRSYNDEGKTTHESHVFLAFGQFSDGSLLIGDMSGSGGTVMLRGTRDENVSRDNSGRLTSEAIDVAEYCMKKFFSDTYEDLKLDTYAKYICAADDYKLDSKMHWYTKGPKAIISDSEGYQNMSGYEVVSDLFGEKITRESVLLYLNKNNKLSKPKITRGRKPHHGRVKI